MSELPILSITILLPLISAVYITFFISQSKSPNKQIYAMYVAVLCGALTLLSTIYLLIKFDVTKNSFQFVERYSWFAPFGLEFHVGVDGISLYFIFLTALLTLICIIASIFTVKKQIKEFLLCFMLLEAACIGAFISLNLLLFYLFFEIVLIPMYIIIGVFGGENRVYAAFKFFIYTFLGSVFFLLALLFIYKTTYSFEMAKLNILLPSLNIETQKILWLATFIAFAIKVPIVPFHTWLPDAHVQAPTGGSMMLAGVLLKLGTYAFLRISLPMFPDACQYFAPYVEMLSTFAIIYGSLVAFAQTDMKKVIAYSSVAHMGFVTGGIFSFTEVGVSGAVFQMISHGVISSALFLIVGILYERNHTKQIEMFGGVATVMPKLAVLFMIAMLGSIGLPGTSGFIGEFMSIFGIFSSYKVLGSIASLGIVMGAIYMLGLYKNIMFGEINNAQVRKFKDLDPYEYVALIPLILLIIYWGIIPSNLLNVINPSVQNLINIFAK